MTTEMTSRCFTLFIVVLSLLTFAVFLSEFLHPYTFLPASLDAFVEIFDWQTRINSSALAFGAIIFVLYQLFMTAAEFIISLGMCVWNRYAAEAVVQDTRKSCTSSISLITVYVYVLVTAIIVNDSFYNREPGTPIISGSFDRLITMVLRAFPVCALELALLFLVFFVIGCWMNRYSDDAFNGQSLSDLESGVTEAADSKPLLPPTRGMLYMTTHVDEKVWLEKERSDKFSA